MTRCCCILMLFFKQLNAFDAVLHIQNIAEKENINVENMLPKTCQINVSSTFKKTCNY